MVRIFVLRILQPATGVAYFGVDHTRHVAQNFFDTPKAAGREHGHLALFSISECCAARSLLIIHNLSPGCSYVGSGSPDCSATMYAAYQSAQLASRTPVRFSCSPCAASARRSALMRSVVESNEVTPVST